MSAFYPCSVWSPTVKTNKVDLVDASHINQAQDEIVAIQNQLQVGLDSDGSIISGTSFPSPAKPSSQFWRTDLSVLYIYTGITWSPQSGITSYQAGDYLIKGPELVKRESSTSFVVVNSIYIPRAGTLRIKFFLKDGSGSGEGRIYRNGSAVGTLRTSTGTGTVHSEDISGWTAGDTCEVYGHGTGGNNIWVGALQLFELEPANEAVKYATYPTPLIYQIDSGTPPTDMGTIGDLCTVVGGGASTTLYVKTGAATWTAK